MQIRKHNIKTHLIFPKKGFIKVGWRYNEEYPRFSTGTNNKVLAEKKGNEIFKKWLENLDDFKPSRKDAFEVEINRYIETQYEYKKPATIVSVKRNLKRLQDSLSVGSISEITKEMFENNAPKLRGDASPKYWTCIIVDIRKFFQWCIDKGILASDPARKIILPPKSSYKKRGLEAIWPDGELEKICEVIYPPAIVHLKILRYTGMDVSDLCFLKKEHIFETENGLQIVKVREKAKSDRETMNQPVNSKLLVIFRQALANDSDRLFTTKTARNFNTHLYRQMKVARKNLKLPMRDLKSLRHTFATKHVERGVVPIDVLRTWMGHAPDSRTLENLYSHREFTAQFMD